LSISGIRNLEGAAAFGACLSGLVHYMPKLRRLNLSFCNLSSDGVRAFHPVLQTNRTLKVLDLSHCQLGDDGIRLLADALVGNTTMEVLNIHWSAITPVGLGDIMRVLQSTDVKTLPFFAGNLFFLFNDEAATQYFVSTLQHARSSVHELLMVDLHLFPTGSRDATYASIQSSLIRNQQLNRDTLLLAPPPLPLQRQQ
jgi:Leucine Rich repeat